jgi:hypothetical protein
MKDNREHDCHNFRELEGSHYNPTTGKIIFDYRCRKCGRTWSEEGKRQ